MHVSISNSEMCLYFCDISLYVSLQRDIDFLLKNSDSQQRARNHISVINQSQNQSQLMVVVFNNSDLDANICLN
jgi:hypothetical protein